MSPGPSLDPAERELLLDEVRSYLPAFLHQGASEQPDPAGDVRELLNLEQEHLDRIVAVHGCLDTAVLACGDAMEEGLRQPFACSTPVAVVSQQVRGQIDWPGTMRHRARSPGERHGYSVREPGQAVDAAENRAVAWLLDKLEVAVGDAAVRLSRRPPDDQVELPWAAKIDRLQRQLVVARAVPWLGGLRAEQPTPQTLAAMRATRSGFYADRVVPALESVLRLVNPTPEALAEILAKRYFEPGDDGTLFQVAVALRIARAFARLSPYPRRTRLLLGEGRSTFARYGFEDGAEVSLAYQSWPKQGKGVRRQLSDRHGLGGGEGIPDLFVVRSEEDGEDLVILELKASTRKETLREGLRELLAYLGDRPEIWTDKPSGWLVAPRSEAFTSADVDPSSPLWMVSADEVAAAATTRFASAAAG